jgi:hypothetical protein
LPKSISNSSRFRSSPISTRVPWFAIYAITA